MGASWRMNEEKDVVMTCVWREGRERKRRLTPVEDLILL